MEPITEQKFRSSAETFPEVNGNSSEKRNRVDERLGFRMEEQQKKEKEDDEEGEGAPWAKGRRRRRRRGRRRCYKDYKDYKGYKGYWRAVSVELLRYMRIYRSCRCGLSAPVMLWTTVCLFLLAKGVSSVSDDHTRFTRSLKYEQDADAQGGINMRETYNVMQFLRELIQRQQQRANQQQSAQSYGGPNGDDVGDRDVDWRKVPLPLFYQIRSLINDGSKEEDKRGSYMSLCHFKICNLG